MNRRGGSYGRVLGGQSNSRSSAASVEVRDILRWGGSGLLQCELLWFWEQEECYGIDDIGQNIYIAQQEGDGDRDRYLGPSQPAYFQGPVIHDHIDKIDDQSDTNNKARIAKKIPVIVCDHEIDLVDAKEHNEK